MDCSWEHCLFSYFPGETWTLFFFLNQIQQLRVWEKRLEKGYVNAAITHTSRCRSAASVRSLFLTTSHEKLARRRIRRPILFFFFLRTTCQFVFFSESLPKRHTCFTIASMIFFWWNASFFFGCLVDGARAFYLLLLFFEGSAFERVRDKTTSWSQLQGEKERKRSTSCLANGCLSVRPWQIKWDWALNLL